MVELVEHPPVFPSLRTVFCHQLMVVVASDFATLSQGHFGLGMRNIPLLEIFIKFENFVLFIGFDL